MQFKWVNSLLTHWNGSIETSKLINEINHRPGLGNWQTPSLILVIRCWTCDLVLPKCVSNLLVTESCHNLVAGCYTFALQPTQFEWFCTALTGMLCLLVGWRLDCTFSCRLLRCFWFRKISDICLELRIQKKKITNNSNNNNNKHNKHNNNNKSRWYRKRKQTNIINQKEKKKGKNMNLEMGFSCWSFVR